MANQINNLPPGTLITQEADREPLQIEFSSQAPRGHNGSRVYRARLVLDTAGDFVVDDPRIANVGAGGAINDTNQSIYVVGFSGLSTGPNTVTFKEQVGGGVVTSLNTLQFAANSGLGLPISNNLLLATSNNAKLIINVTGFPYTCTVYYVIAGNWNMNWGFR